MTVVQTTSEKEEGMIAQLCFQPRREEPGTELNADAFRICSDVLTVAKELCSKVSREIPPDCFLVYMQKHGIKGDKIVRLYEALRDKDPEASPVSVCGFFFCAMYMAGNGHDGWSDVVLYRIMDTHHVETSYESVAAYIAQKVDGFDNRSKDGKKKPVVTSLTQTDKSILGMSPESIIGRVHGGNNTTRAILNRILEKSKINPEFWSDFFLVLDSLPGIRTGVIATLHKMMPSVNQTEKDEDFVYVIYATTLEYSTDDGVVSRVLTQDEILDSVSSGNLFDMDQLQEKIDRAESQLDAS